LNFDKKKFAAKIPAAFQEIYGVLQTFGFVPTLVGGTIRDYLLTGEIGTDWDLELTHPTVSFNKSQWKDLGVALSALGKTLYLPYEIIRVDYKKYQFEFSPPRKEIFSETTGHSNFAAGFDFKLPFEQAVLRRDFTINAMGIRFTSLKEFEFLDPLNGLVHLRDKLLHHAGPNFSKDPVRFLRAIRFSEKMHFQFTDGLTHVLESMQLEGISSTYVWSELQKSHHPIAMLKKLLDWQQVKPELKLPLTFAIMNPKWEELSRVLDDPSKHETWMVALEWIGVPSESWQKFFSVSSETCSRLARWAESSKKFIQLKPEVFHGEFEVIRNLPEFNLLFDWYFTTKQLLQKNPTLPLLPMVEHFLPDWIHLYRFEPVKDVKHIDPPLRAKYQVWNLCQRL
jgi:tRNA nucleotidyltransferase/poly(A) polymerase